MARFGGILAMLALVAILSALPFKAAAQQELPHVLLGTAVLNGEVPPVGTEIVAMTGITKPGTARTKYGGKFTLPVSRPPGGSVITFTVAGVNASERLTDWEFGKIQPGFNLTTRNLTVAEALEPLIRANNLVSVWRFDNNTKAWFFYVPGLVDDSTLDTMSAKETCLIRVMNSAEVVLNGTTRNLTCMGGNCWNQIVW